MGPLKADVVVIGGGAAGSMCALTAAQRGLHVVLLEPNKMLGKKLRITGKGRCNVTNHCDVKTILANIPGDGRFLYSALNRLGPQDTMALFESLGVPLKTERGNRVFPVSDRSHDVANALERAYAHAGGKVVHAAATDILTQDGAVSAVVTTEGAIDCDAAVICTGGLSYPLTGSTGDGYRFAQRLGHTVTPTRASLVPLESDDPWCAEMQGFSLRNVTLTVYDEQNKAVYSDLGEMLFTHFGVSGPLVLSASAHMRDFSRHKYRLSIDLKPALDEKKLDARILRDFQKYANRDFKNALYDLAGHAMIPVLVRLSGIPIRRSTLSRASSGSGSWSCSSIFRCRSSARGPSMRPLLHPAACRSRRSTRAPWAPSSCPGCILPARCSIWTPIPAASTCRSHGAPAMWPEMRSAHNARKEMNILDTHITVAIDGPSGAGKSTIARAAARRFGLIYVDTGAIYRTVGLACERAGADCSDTAAVQVLLPELKIELAYDAAGEQRMLLNGEDVSDTIRLPEVSLLASRVSALPVVRAFLLDMQRDLARTHSAVMDGRDIGTVVLPDAGLKIFLSASAECRAQRRYRQLQEKGIEEPYADVLRELEQRDYDDTHRAVAPLKAAPDAVHIDTSDLTLDESIDAVCAAIRTRFGVEGKA